MTLSRLRADDLYLRTTKQRKVCLAMRQPFNSIYSHGFIRAAVCVPLLRVADPAYNTEQTIELARRASVEHAAVALFPELGISAYSNDDLFQQDALLEETVAALARLVEESRKLE